MSLPCIGGVAHGLERAVPLELDGDNPALPVQFESATEGTLLDGEPDWLQSPPEGVPITVVTGGHTLTFELYQTEVTITAFE